jgi:hypothetical protein
VEANAGIPALIPRFDDDATTHFADSFVDDADAVPNADADLPPGITQRLIDLENVPATANPPWRLLEEQRIDPNLPSNRAHGQTNDFQVSHRPQCGTGARPASATMTPAWWTVASTASVTAPLPCRSLEMAMRVVTTRSYNSPQSAIPNQPEAELSRRGYCAPCWY